ncbi:MAG: methyltransferase domain-containing protein [Boseongicola sp.]|nr:MAG: methyltransferase domain-containing protein [Boseongicola sp.]
MERTGWGQASIAKGYANGFGYAVEKVAGVLTQAVAVLPGEEVLDLCCGHGVVSHQLVKIAANVTGLDFSPAMIDLSRESVPEGRFVEGDAMSMPFDNNSFDAVTIGFGIPHLPDPEAALDEVARVLRPGGRLALSVWQGKGSGGAFGWLFDAVGAHGNVDVTLPAGPDAHAYADTRIAFPALEKAGFVEPDLKHVASQFLLNAPEDLFDVFAEGAVRAAALLKAQPHGRGADIRAAMAKRVRAEGIHGTDGWLVPMPSVVVSALRP